MLPALRMGSELAILFASRRTAGTHQCASKTLYQRCDDCVDETKCAVRLVMMEVRNALANVLDNQSLAQVCAMQLLSTMVSIAEKKKTLTCDDVARVKCEKITDRRLYLNSLLPLGEAEREVADSFCSCNRRDCLNLTRSRTR